MQSRTQWQTNTIQKLYHQTLAIRPKLIKLIEKYSQKKGELRLLKVTTFKTNV